MLSIQEAREKYQKQILAIKSFEAKVSSLGYVVHKNDEFELGADWALVHNNKEVGLFTWNVPHILKLEIDHRVCVDEDYLDSFDIWQSTLEYCKKILTNEVQTRK